MKKMLLAATMLLAIGYSASAQFNVEIGISGQLPQGDFADAYDLGVGFSLEPRITISDQLDAGLYLGSLAFAGGDLAAASGGGATASSSIDAAAIVPVLATGTYRIIDAKVTPYVGAGLGMYFSRTAAADAGGSTVDDTTNSDFGFAARGGLFLGRMNLGVTYHNAGDISFLQFGLGVRIGPR